MRNFDLILDKIGQFGRYQKFYWFLASLFMVSAGIQNVLNVFLLAKPEHWCHVPELTNLSPEEQTVITSGSRSLGASDDVSCEIYAIDYAEAESRYLNNETLLTTNSTKKCANWDYDLLLYGRTAVTEWDLVCGKSTFTSIAQSLYMLGFLFGAIIFGHLSDRFGRKLTLCFSSVGTAVFGVVSALMPGYWSHVVLRMLTALCASGNMAVGFVMGLEFIGKDKRVAPGLCAQIYFACGYMLLAGIACLVRDFRWTNLLISAFGLCLVIFSLIVLPKSARWLISQGRIVEARDELRRAAEMNGVDDVDIDGLLDDYTNSNEELPKDTTHYNMLDLLRTPNMRKKTLNMFFNWFVTSMVYYGLTMGVTDLAGDPYLNLFISGLIECVSIILTIFVLDSIGRRIPLAFVLVTAGLTCIVGGLLPESYLITRTVLSMIGKFGISSSFAIIYVFTAELFPTVVRTIGVGGGSMCARVGGLLAPFVGDLSVFWAPLPTIVFGGFSLAAGILSLLFPETLGQKLPDTLEEGEQFGRDDSLCSCCRRKEYNVYNEMKRMA